MSSMARARRATPSGPSRYATLGNSTVSFMGAPPNDAPDWESAGGWVSLMIAVYQIGHIDGSHRRHYGSAHDTGFVLGTTVLAPGTRWARRLFVPRRAGGAAGGAARL